MYIVLAGNIGSGKTSTCQRLSQLIPAKVFFEKTEETLSACYTAPSEFAFENQLAYSIQYLEQAQEIASCIGVVFQDRSIYDTHGVFSELQYRRGFISSPQMALLGRLFECAHRTKEPDLLVVLDCKEDTSWARIKARNLSEDRLVSFENLELLRKRYREWFDNFNVCDKLSLNTDELSQAEVVGQILGRVTPALKDYL